MSKPLYLYFPQWQGSGDSKAIWQGAENVFAKIRAQYPWQIVPVENELAPLEANILGHRSLLRQFQAAQKIIHEAQPTTIFTLGGDCSVELAPVAYLNAKYQGDLAVIWLDAHGDLNTPESSPSHQFHGMPLRLLLGDGDPVFLKQIPALLKPEQVALVGARELDDPEQQYIQRNRLQTFGVQQLDAALAWFKNSAYQHVYVHVDLDVTEPQVLPSVKCPTPLGIQPDVLKKFLGDLNHSSGVVGGSVLEFTATADVDVEKVASLVWF